MSSTTIREAIDAKVAASSEVVKDRLVTLRAEEVLASRTTVLNDAYVGVDALRTSLKKIDRPDVVQFGRDGKPLGEGTYSDARAKDIKKTEENLGKLETALTKAWSPEATNEDFKKLREVINQTKGTGKPDGKSEE